MMYLNALWYLQLSLSLTASAWSTKRSKLPVCIIGAGPAGLSAASRLEEKGVKAVIFDKQVTLGGKCQSYYDEK
jgi:cation diffusion facilitator CzcD-associated flavoprotein CzcO